MQISERQHDPLLPALEGQLVDLNNAIIFPSSFGRPASGPEQCYIFSLPDLEGQLVDLNDAISAATTLAAVGDERINSIVDFFFPSIGLGNSQQDALSMDYANQVSQSHTDGERGGAECLSLIHI